MSRRDLGWGALAALTVVWFLLLDRYLGGFTLAALGIIALLTAAATAWVLNIVLVIVSHYRTRERGGPFGRLLRRTINDQTPATPRLTRYAVALLAATLVVSATVGTGVAPIDAATPSYNVSSGSLGPPGQPTDSPNTAQVGGSFGKMRINDDGTITVFIDDTSNINGVIVVGPDDYQLASARVDTGTRRVDMNPTRPLTNGTYEVIGVALDVNQQNILLSQSEEVESHQVTLNVTAR